MVGADLQGIRMGCGTRGSCAHVRLKARDPLHWAACGRTGTAVHRLHRHGGHPYRRAKPGNRLAPRIQSKKADAGSAFLLDFFGGDGRNRTADLWVMNPGFSTFTRVKRRFNINQKWLKVSRLEKNDVVSRCLTLLISGYTAATRKRSCSLLTGADHATRTSYS